MAHCYWHDALAAAAAGSVVTLTGEKAHHAVSSRPCVGASGCS